MREFVTKRVKVVDTLNNLGADIGPSDIFRLHRSSKPRTTDDGRTVSQTIVKFTNWSARASAYSTRFDGGTMKERMARPGFVNLDLTKRRLGLLARAKKALKDHPNAHSYANSECRLVVRNRRNKVDYFYNTNVELDEILGFI